MKVNVNASPSLFHGIRSREGIEVSSSYGHRTYIEDESLGERVDRDQGFDEEEGTSPKQWRRLRTCFWRRLSANEAALESARRRMLRRSVGVDVGRSRVEFQGHRGTRPRGVSSRDN